MSKPDLMTLAQEERTDLLALLKDLTDEQWNAPSPCTKWRVRDVATHIVSYDELSAPATLRVFIRGGLRINAVNAVALQRYGDLQPSAIIDLLERNLRPGGSPRGSAGASHSPTAPSTSRTSGVRLAYSAPSQPTARSRCSTSHSVHRHCRPRRTPKGRA